MLIDDKNLVSRDQAITATANSTDVIDLAVAARGAGNGLDLFVHVTEAFNNLTSLAVAVQTATDSAFTTPVTHQTVSRTLASGGLAAGKKIDLGSLLEGAQRYMRFVYTVTGTAPTTGKLTGGIAAFGTQTLVGQA